MFFLFHEYEIKSWFLHLCVNEVLNRSLFSQKYQVPLISYVSSGMKGLTLYRTHRVQNILSPCNVYFILSFQLSTHHSFCLLLSKILLNNRCFNISLLYIEIQRRLKYKGINIREIDTVKIVIFFSYRKLSLLTRAWTLRVKAHIHGSLSRRKI